MTEKFRNMYRIPSARASWWDYTNSGAYFVTLNSDNHKNHYFGRILKGQMQLSVIGQIASECWQKIPHQFPIAETGVFVIMPNHLHGIVIINKTQIPKTDCIVDVVETRLIASLPQPQCENPQKQNHPNTPSVTPNKSPGGIAGKHNPMLTEGLGRIMRWYKGRVTFESRKTNPLFAWQSRYYDHIIRNEESYQRISKYIMANPENWPDDKFYSA